MEYPQEVPIRCFAVSAVLIREDSGFSQVLMLRRAGGALDEEWCQVAGKINTGETAWQAALREIREETGLVPERFYTADICEQFYEAGLECISLVPVFVGFIDPMRVVVLDDEHSEYRWMTFSEAQAVVPAPGQRAMIEHVRQEFVARRPTEWLRIETTA
jgi:dATP pyrophosphohydrolase